MYRDNDSGLRPSSYPYLLGRALNQYKINTSVTIYISRSLERDKSGFSLYFQDNYAHLNN